jgi:hypothetical protein
MKQAWRKFIRDYPDCDVLIAGNPAASGRGPEILRNRSHKSPGHGLPEDAPMNQYIEAEYMKADEYDALIKDPTDFFLRTYLPRVMGAFEGFSKLLPFRFSFGFPATFMNPCVLPEVQASFQAIIDYGKELARTNGGLGVMPEITQEGLSMGYPQWIGGGQAHVPFDLLGDTLRGTKGILMDMHRQPEKLLEAMEVVTGWALEMIQHNARNSMRSISSSPISFIALHKGDDHHMSDKQFETFYWPHFRRVMMGLIHEGYVPLLFAEGAYNRRLAQIKDGFPEGSVIWWFDKTDMAEAKRTLGGVQCIAGNVPTSLICTGTPQEVKDYCRQVINVCRPGGGYILMGGAQVHHTPHVADNLHAMMEAASEYGRYH